MDCVHNLGQVKLSDIDPSGPYTSGEHLELDYLIPVRRTCIVGEIKGGRSSSSIKRDYQNFKDRFQLLRKIGAQNRFDKDFWKSLGVPESQLYLFNQVQELKGLFIIRALNEVEIELADVRDIALCYRSNWDLLEWYAEGIGTYTRHYFESLFEIPLEEPEIILQISSQRHGLSQNQDRIITSGTDAVANIYTFNINPYNLLPIADVYRRTNLPSLKVTQGENYQRPLRAEKLDAIRKILKSSRNFMFPSSILVVLSSTCKYEKEQETGPVLQIPGSYGSLTVIDGQHRLFSYADNSVRNFTKDNARIAVTAIEFKDVPEEEIYKFSARTFVEVNTKQTPVPSDHMDAIAYSVLGETSPKALAAHIILKANTVRRSKLHGLFKTSQTTHGIIPTPTVVSSLKSIVSLNNIQRLQPAQRGARLKEQRGYKQLMGVKSFDELVDVPTLVNRSRICFTRYFNLVGKVFKNDWPQREIPSQSSLALAKMFAAFVKLLKIFIKEGADWGQVDRELRSIHDNIARMTPNRGSDNLLFDRSDSQIPDATNRISQMLKFLDANRVKPTSILQV